MANANRQPQPISPRQIKIIHTIKTKLGIDDAAYRTLLRGYAVMTSKDLTWREAEELIGELIMRLQNSPKLDNVSLRFTQEKVIQQGSGIEFDVTADIADSVEQQEKPKEDKGNG